MKEDINIFTVRRTEAAPVKRETVEDIDFRREFPFVMNADAGEISLVRDRRVRLTECEKQERRQRIAIEKAKELDAFVIGVASGCSGLAFIVALMMHFFGV